MRGHVLVAFHRDREEAQKIIAHLRSEGFAVDSDDGTGASTQDELDERVRECAVLVPVISGQSVNSTFVMRITELARELSKPIVAYKSYKPNVDWIKGAPIVNAVSRAPLQALVKKLEAFVERTVTDGINDIIRVEDLIRYAVKAQLHHVGAGVPELTKPGTGISESDLAPLNGVGTFSLEKLRDLDEAIVVLGYYKGKHYTGGLAQFAARIRDQASDDSSSIGPPSSWTSGTLNMKPDDEVHLLAKASTIVNNFVVADRLGVPSATIREHHNQAITQVVDGLILLAGGPQTPRHNEALLLLGNLAKYAFEIVRDRLSVSIRRSPLGFRTWRSVTKLVKLASHLSAQQADLHSELVGELRVWLMTLVNAAGEIRKSSIYPGRSLDLELFIAIPPEWGATPGGGDLVNKALLERAEDVNATLRERGTASMGLWQRAWASGRSGDPVVRAQIEALIARFEVEAGESDIATGLQWVATTLRKVLADDAPVCNTFPDPGQPWFQAVEQYAGVLVEIGLPEEISLPTRDLFRHALLQNAGVERRKAIDTLVSGGLVDLVANQLLRVMQDKRSEPWLRIRALFALGFMQVRSEEAEEELIRACENAADVVMAGGAGGAQIAELQEGLFAIGDTFGLTGVEDAGMVERARRVRNRLRPTLEGLVDGDHTKEWGRHTIARALAYLLTFTAQPGRDDLSRLLLDRLKTHPDDVTRNFSRWALSFRWDGEGGLRSLLHGTH